MGLPLTNYHTIMNIEKDIKIANYIFDLLGLEAPISMSWGIDFDSVQPIPCGVSFDVAGFKHKGPVQVVLDEASDLFVVRLLSEEGELLSTTESVFADDLVHTIDELVEHCDDYEEMVKKFYGLT